MREDNRHSRWLRHVPGVQFRFRPRWLPRLSAWALLLAVLVLASACDTGSDDKKKKNSSSQTPEETVADLTGDDPYLPEQWHLENTGQESGTAGEDARVLTVWEQGLDGHGVTMAVVDDGLEIAHEDLVANVSVEGSLNYLDNSTDPTGGQHGTAVAGVMAAARNNRVGGAGVAPRAELVGYNVLQTGTVADITHALLRGFPQVAVSNNSWGPVDTTGELAGLDSQLSSALQFGVANGREGKGVVYVWAAGNGGEISGKIVDNSNYDGYANNPWVLPICAVGDKGARAYYSERGANLLVCAPSLGDSGHGITTVDRSGANGYNTGTTVGDYTNTNYTNSFGGTSSAAPLAAGVVALLLEANPNLTWRDVRAVLARSARKNDAANAEWTTNGAGLNINHNYGFGVVDATAAVALAQTWSPLPAERVYTTAQSAPTLAIPDSPAAGISDTITVSGSAIGSIEHITVILSVSDHTSWGDLNVNLVNVGTGTTSNLAEKHICVNLDALAVVLCQFSFSNWRFGSLRHLGEAADGAWRLDITDTAVEDVGTFQSWQLEFRGH